MPRYLYRNWKGEELWVERPVSERDHAPAPGFKRVNSFESAPAVCPKGPPSQGVEVLRGFKKVEQDLGTTEAVRRTGYPPKLVKHVWSTP